MFQDRGSQGPRLPGGGKSGTNQEHPSHIDKAQANGAVAPRATDGDISLHIQCRLQALGGGGHLWKELGENQELDL